MATAPTRTEFRTTAVHQVAPLREAASGRIALRIIEPGWGASGYYGAEMLERDGPRVFRQGLHMFLDHPSLSEDFERPERTVRDLAAVLATDAEWRGDGLYAEADVFGTHRELIAELAPHVGVSIRAFGFSEWGEAEGREGEIVTALVEAISVDFVTVPGAGGRVLAILESARSRSEEEQMAENDLKEARDRVAALERELAEARTAHQAAVTERDTSLTALEAEKDAAEQEAARLREAVAISEAAAVVTEELGRHELHDAAVKRLGEALRKNPPMTDEGKLDIAALTERVKQAAEAELAYLAELGATRGEGKVRGMGGLGNPEPVDEASAIATYRRLGLSDEAAKVAVKGR